MKSSAKWGARTQRAGGRPYRWHRRRRPACRREPIVSINKGKRDGMERGHVLALWRAGKPATDTTGARRETVQSPDEKHGTLFVFRTFERVSYALILGVQEPVRAGDRFTQP